jgi:DNA-binding NarL/FixJ family response regulator
MKLLLVEDEPIWQRAIAGLITAQPGWNLCAMVDTFDAAIAAYHTHQPDVVLLDWQIRGPQDGLAVGHALLALGHSADRLVLVSGSPPHLIPVHPFQAVPKHLIPLQLIETLQAIPTNRLR